MTEGIEVHPDHQLVAPNAVRSQALQLLLDQVRAGPTTAADYLAVARLQADALVTVDQRLAALAEGLVPLAQVGALSKA